ncbi:MAG: hypothetical protein ABI743_01945, partial [bacterium]
MNALCSVHPMRWALLLTVLALSACTSGTSPSATGGSINDPSDTPAPALQGDANFSNDFISHGSDLLSGSGFLGVWDVTVDGTGPIEE